MSTHATAPDRFTVTTISGATREVPAHAVDSVVGLDPDGRIVVDHFDALIAPRDGSFLFGLTLCCDASDKGAEHGVVCRACYSEEETGAYLFAVLTSAGDWTYPGFDPIDPGRFVVRRDKVHKFWGVYDNTLDTWAEGDYADAFYAAGIPMWKDEARARNVATDMNAVLIALSATYTVKES